MTHAPITRLAAACLLALLCASPTTTAAFPSSLPDSLRSEAFKPTVIIGGQFFISYEDGRVGGAPYSHFFINRGYINVRAEVTPWLSGRITPDIAVDREGDGEGDLELRLKYCYMQAELPELAVLTSPSVEFGLVGRPWLEFEQKVNLYRVQGSMFVERADILNSADFGATFSALLGGSMPEEYQRDVSSYAPGRYGSIAIGLYNGGGYHAIEHNLNKSLEYRLSLRPLHALIPGLQLTYAGAVGKGNVEKQVDWNMHIAYLSMEHRAFTVAGTWFVGEGNAKGKLLDTDGTPRDQSGWSAFADVRIPGTPLSVFGRYDHYAWDNDPSEWEENTLIAGLTWHVNRKNKLLLDYERVSDADGEELSHALKLSAELAF